MATMTERSAAVPARLPDILSAFIARRVPPGARLCVAFSGGRDSAVLLHALSGLAAVGEPSFALSALHVHHGLSPQADAWAGFCAEFCGMLGVELTVARVEVPRDSGEGLEAAARRARHAVFSRCAADFLALAHHRDDQAETVLLNLLRGAGLAGAGGMPAERPQANGPCLVRPLLDVPRRDIEAYARAQGLAWIEDESNADMHFRRNFLRRDIMPRLEERFPGAAASLARAAGHFAEGAMLLDELAALDRQVVAMPSGRIGLSGFNALSSARARNLLRCEWVAAGFRAPDARWIEEARCQLATATALSEICVATPEAELHVYRGELHVLARRQASAQAVAWNGEAALPWAGGRILFLTAKGEGLPRELLCRGPTRLAPRQGGERLQPDVRRPRRRLRKLLQEGAIPPWERPCLPLLWVGERLVWAGGIGTDAGFACAPGEEGIVPLWEPPVPFRG